MSIWLFIYHCSICILEALGYFSLRYSSCYLSHPCIFITVCAVQHCNKPGAYHRYEGTQDRGHPKWDSSPSQSTHCIMGTFFPQLCFWTVRRNSLKHREKMQIPHTGPRPGNKSRGGAAKILTSMLPTITSKYSSIWYALFLCISKMYRVCAVSLTPLSFKILLTHNDPK